MAFWLRVDAVAVCVVYSVWSGRELDIGNHHKYTNSSVIKLLDFIVGSFVRLVPDRYHYLVPCIYQV